MPEGGRLFVSTSLRRATRRGAAAAFLEVRFRDTGVGIPPGDLRNLFIPFFTTKEKGTGPGPAHQPAHHREPRRHHRGALAGGDGGHLHGPAAGRVGRLRGLRREEAGRAALRGRPVAAGAGHAAADSDGRAPRRCARSPCRLRHAAARPSPATAPAAGAGDETPRRCSRPDTGAGHAKRCRRADPAPQVGCNARVPARDQSPNESSSPTTR